MHMPMSCWNNLLVIPELSKPAFRVNQNTDSARSSTRDEDPERRAVDATLGGLLVLPKARRRNGE